MKTIAHYTRRMAYFLLFWFLLIWAEVELSIYNVQYVWHRIIIIVLLFADGVLSMDLSHIVAQKFEGGRLGKQR